MKTIVERHVANSWPSSDRMLALVDLSPDGIVVHDGQQVVFANAAALGLVGAARPDQVIGKPIETFLEPPYLKTAQQDIHGTSHWSKFAPPVRDKLRRLDATEMAVEVRALGFTDNGQPFVHLVLRDISERVAREEASSLMDHRLQQAQRMEDVGALAGGVAHEVNNMMTVVLGFCEFLLEDGHLNDGARPDVEEITKAAKRAAAITQQLLAFSRRTATRPEVVDLSAAVLAAKSTAQRILGSVRVLTWNTDVHANICIDPAHLEQVLVNLILNARDATTNGAVITVTTNVLALAFGETCAEGAVIPAGEYATLSVRDDGEGMSAEIQRRIFEPFFTTKALGKGTGLGLAAVIGLLRQSGCYIGVRSAPGQGAEFLVYFPIEGTMSTNQIDRHAIAHHPAVIAPKNTVLFIDQEPSLRIIAIRTLEHAGYSVVTARDSRESIALIALHGPPSIVVTDAMVASVHGRELARQLSVEWPALPVVLMTAYLPADFYLAEVPQAATRTMQKPFTPSQLLNTVAAALAQATRQTLAAPTI